MGSCSRTNSDDDAAKATVARLCDELAYPALDVGPLARAAELEHLAWLWISLAMTGRFGGHAFALLRKPKLDSTERV